MKPVRFLVPALCALAALAAPLRAEEGPVTLPDSTTLERFTLPNGLRVVARNVPNAGRIAISLAFGGGYREDPSGEEGRAALVAELYYFAATASAPSRTRAEMPSLRPQGWNLTVSPWVTQCEEMATREQFPGVLQQVAERLSGVRLAEQDLRDARATVAADLAANYGGRPELALYYRAAAASWDLPEAAISRYESGRGLQAVTLAKARAEIARRCVPGNAALSIAGNLEGFPVRRLVEGAFGALPSGTRVNSQPPAHGDSTTRIVTRADLSAPAGVYGILAPALADTIHPEFLLAAVLFGSQCIATWGPPSGALTTRFQYAVFEDPTLIRLYPELEPSADGIGALEVPMHQAISDFRARTPTPETVKAAWRALDWLLGGPVPPELQARLRTDLGTLHTVCATAATRELWGGEVFWASYRARFREVLSFDPSQWSLYFRLPTSHVRVLLQPARR